MIYDAAPIGAFEGGLAAPLVDFDAMPPLQHAHKLDAGYHAGADEAQLAHTTNADAGYSIDFALAIPRRHHAVYLAFSYLPRRSDGAGISAALFTPAASVDATAAHAPAASGYRLNAVPACRFAAR